MNKIKQEKNISEIQIEYKGIKNYSASCFDFLNKLIFHKIKTLFTIIIKLQLN